MYRYRESFLKIAGNVVLAAGLLAAVSGCAHSSRPHVVQGAPPAEPRIWPVDHPNPLITSEFGARRSTGTGQTRTHKGLDIAVPMRTPVLATAGGLVTFSGVQGDYGHLIVIEHDPTWATAYAHLSERLVQRGQRVHRGQMIGRVGRSGNATGPHLHYEVRRNGQPVNPRPYLP